MGAIGGEGRGGFALCLRYFRVRFGTPFPLFPPACFPVYCVRLTGKEGPWGNWRGGGGVGGGVVVVVVCIVVVVAGVVVVVVVLVVVVGVVVVLSCI